MKKVLLILVLVLVVVVWGFFVFYGRYNEFESLTKVEGRSWIHNSSASPLNCQAVCKNNNSNVVEKGCFDKKFEACTVSVGNDCRSNDINYLVYNDFSTSCCCDTSETSYVYEQTFEKNNCKSSDGFSPFIKGDTIAAVNGVSSTYTETCSGSVVMDNFCDARGQNVIPSDVRCPSGCVDGVCSNVGFLKWLMFRITNI